MKELAVAHHRSDGDNISNIASTALARGGRFGEPSVGADEGGGFGGAGREEIAPEGLDVVRVNKGPEALSEEGAWRKAPGGRGRGGDIGEGKVGGEAGGDIDLVFNQSLADSGLLTRHRHGVAQDALIPLENQDFLKTVPIRGVQGSHRGSHGEEGGPGRRGGSIGKQGAATVADDLISEPGTRRRIHKVR